MQDKRMGPLALAALTFIVVVFVCARGVLAGARLPAGREAPAARPERSAGDAQAAQEPKGVQEASRIDPFYLRQLQDGKDLHAQGRFEEAQGVLKIASFGLADAPDLLLECLVYQAVGNLRLGDAAAARRCYDDVARLKLNDRLAAITLPEEVRERYLKGAAMLEPGGREEILELKAALRKDPKDPDLHHRLFKAYERLDMRNDAKSALKDWLRLEPGNVGARVALAAALLDEKKPKDALRELRKVGSPREDDLEFHYLLGRALYGTMNFAAALDEFQQVTGIEPGYKDAARLLEDCRSRVK